MNGTNKKRVLRSLALCAMSATMLFGGSCGKPKDEKDKIAVITKQDISFWRDVENGAKDAGDELGYEIIYRVATADNDYASQIQYINEAIDKGAKAIVIAPNGNDELADAYAKADAAGVKLININSRSSYENILTCVSSSDLDCGAIAARYSAKTVLQADDIRAQMTAKDANVDFRTVMKLGHSAIAIVPHTAATAANRVKGYKEECINQIKLAMANDGLSFEAVGKQFTDEQIASAFENFFIQTEGCSSVDAAYNETMKLLQGSSANKIRTILATNTNTSLGVAKAVQELDRSDIYVVGFNSDEQELAHLRTGVIDGLIVQNPYNIGYVGVAYAKKAINGDKFPTALDTGATFVDANNLNDDYVQLLLYPDKF